MILAGPPIDAMFLGPTAGLAIALVVLQRFATGKILPRNTVPREDYDAVVAINASLVASIPPLTASVNTMLERDRQNGRR